MFPCAYLLLSGKTTEIYKSLLEELINAALKFKLVLRPELILTDFELAAINAFKFYFPNAQIIGCWFHYGQCLFKKLVAFGLKSQYKNDPELRKWFKGFVALASIPVHKVI